jgi:hypothetical protein
LRVFGRRIIGGQVPNPAGNIGGAYDVNTIANYDRDIIPLLDAPAGSAFMRDPRTGKFVEVEYEPEE